MSRRQYLPPTSPARVPQGATELPLDRPIGVYYRQSTDAQIGNVSTTMQTVDMVKYLQDRGWPAHRILMIDMDSGVSGTTKIDEREGMRLLFDLITDGHLGAVACQDEDRLFRDVTQIQVNIFIEACKTTQTLVLTPSMVYDFAHPQMGSFHARQFRFKCEMAAEYISSYIKGRLHPAKHSLMLEGKWAGWSVPLGYLVDNRKHLEDGGRNPHYRKYVPYEPFAAIVRDYFRLFLQYAGNIHATVRHLYDHGPYYPHPKTTVVPEGFRFVPSYRLKDYGKGYCLGEAGLVGLLSNVVYIGHWTVQDRVVRWDNHPPIIDSATFFRAFNYLSDTGLDGQPNPHFQPYHLHARPSLDAHRPVERPLFSGLLYTAYEGQRRRASTFYKRKAAHYAYAVSTPYPIERVLWWRRADYIDAALSALVVEKVKVTFDATEWQHALQRVKSGVEDERRVTRKQLEVLEQTMANLLLSLETLSHPELIKRVQTRYADAEQEHARLLGEVQSASGEAGRLEALLALQQSCLPAIENWPQLSHPEQVQIVHSFVQQVMVDIGEGTALSFTLHWLDGSTDTLELAQQSTTFVQWLPREAEALRALVQAGAAQDTLCAAFPTRRWKTIRAKVGLLFGTGVVTFTLVPVKDDETYADYLTRTAGGTAVYRARSGDRWKRADADHLARLVAQGATQVEIAAAFPHRNWARLRAKITRVCGASTVIPGAASENGLAGEIRKHETYTDYCARQQVAGKDIAMDSATGDSTTPDEDELGCATSHSPYWMKQRNIARKRWKCYGNRLKIGS